MVAGRLDCKNGYAFYIIAGWKGNSQSIKGYVKPSNYIEKLLVRTIVR